MKAEITPAFFLYPPQQHRISPNRNYALQKASLRSWHERATKEANPPPSYYLYNTTAVLDEMEEELFGALPQPRSKLSKLSKLLCSCFILCQKKSGQDQTTKSLGNDLLDSSSEESKQAAQGLAQKLVNPCASPQKKAQIIQAVFRALGRFHAAGLSGLKNITVDHIRITQNERGQPRAQFDFKGFWQHAMCPKQFLQLDDLEQTKDQQQQAREAREAREARQDSQKGDVRRVATIVLDVIQDSSVLESALSFVIPHLTRTAQSKNPKRKLSTTRNRLNPFSNPKTTSGRSRSRSRSKKRKSRA